MSAPQSQVSLSPTSHDVIIVMGVSGVGKTTLATLLARQLRCSFIEGDSLHDERCVGLMRSGIALTDADRWPWLDRVGAALASAAAEHTVAVGACSALRRSYRDRLRSAITIPVRFVLLQAPRTDVEQRMRQRSAHYMPIALLDSQLATLEVPTDEDRVLLLDARQPPEALVAATLDWRERS